MFKLLRKSIVLAATLALFVQTVCFAVPKTCSCDSACHAQAACSCQSATHEKTAGCPHCRKKSETNSADQGNHVTTDSACHCHLTLPDHGGPIFTPSSDVAPQLPTPANAVSFMPVCCRTWRSADSFSAWLPDANFRQIFLCVWLT